MRPAALQERVRPLRRHRSLQLAPISHWALRMRMPPLRLTPTAAGIRLLRQGQFPRGFFSSRKQRNKSAFGKGNELRQARQVREKIEERERTEEDEETQSRTQSQPTAWTSFTGNFESFSKVTDIEWSTIPDRVVDMIVPEWSKSLPMYIRKLQHELSMAPGSLADEIWNEAHDPFINPEIQYKANVRVSDELCDDEKEYLARRKKVATAALARYLGLDEKEVHPDDVPTIAMCGSGGGLRALVASAGSLAATQDDGLFDCVTYTAGVSGSCWLQTLYNSSITNGRFDRLIAHVKARIAVHIAYPPIAFSSVLSAPTNKLLLSSMVEKLRGDSNADFGLVDVYGILLAARLLVPKGELEVNDRDFKLSNQRDYIKYGQNPMPIYTVVRHEIPVVGGAVTQDSPSEQAKKLAKQEAWFQWFEVTPYEFFCEEFNAGIPTWAMGRKFENGVDVPQEVGFHLPEVRMPILMGTFGSAFCATLSHYYREIRPLVKSLSGFRAVDEMIYGRNDDLEKVHPIDPTKVPNFVYGMEDQLRFTTPTKIYENEYIQLMDAGMSNNLPIYPLLRPGRNVDVIVAFDASADIKTENWLSVADGYARQRGIKGWPVGAGWPKSGETPQETEKELAAAAAASPAEAETRLREAQKDDPATPQSTSEQERKALHDQSHPEDSDLGYCTIWVGTTEERSSEPPPPSKALRDDTTWQLMEPDAGIAVAYLPFVANEKVQGVDPASSEYMSTWNFVYTPDEVDKVVALARANFDEGKEQIRACVRAVYERKKKQRLEKEKERRREGRRRLRRLGIEGKLGEGDHFS
ncbi:acyl transferase/acyl hydrolase/lysophospholipase [Pseudomassariella vexata]|uniref:Lysophospholipase n=1 Tax=Pseudomassariella vexata TaxID=1141098 RepID=A0A1Y2E095_9PEZI|nr:acyl transferase/acyl hydrolase/lysophospholipase [Pseudomassariella vexata]ORY64917.1 acyl transferase/acyl hydrolase/lysophospholipase [Pseudomassariella vexata]